MRSSVLPVLALLLAHAAAAAPIDSTGYSLIGSIDQNAGGRRLVADREHAIYLDDIFQRFDLSCADSVSARIETYLPETEPSDAVRFAGRLRVLESHGDIWTREGGKRIALGRTRYDGYGSLAVSGQRLICGGVRSDSGWDHWPIFHTLRADSLGGLDLECVVEHLDSGTNASHIVADREGGLYIANYGAAYGGRLGSDGCVEFLDPIFFGGVGGLAISPETGLLYIDQYPGVLGIYRIVEAGRAVPVGVIDPGEPLGALAVHHDPARRRDLVAATSGDSLFVYEASMGGRVRRLIADGKHPLPHPQLTFLDSGRLVCNSGHRALCLWHGRDFSKHRHLKVPQSSIGGFVPLTGDKALANGYGGLRLACRLPSGTYKIESDSIPSLRIETASDSLAYATLSVGYDQWIHVVDHREGLAVVDSFVNEPVGGGTRYLQIAGGYLVSEQGVYDLEADARRPPFIGAFRDRDFYSRFDARPFPGAPDDLLIVNSDGAFKLLLWRVSRTEGLSNIWAGYVDCCAGISQAFDDTRDLLYWEQTNEPAGIHVYDISDPYTPLLLHFEPTNSFPRSTGGLEVLKGIVHTNSFNGDVPGRPAYQLRAYEWKGSSLDQLGPMLEEPIAPFEMGVDRGRLVINTGTVIELDFDPVRACSFEARGHAP